MPSDLRIVGATWAVPNLGTDRVGPEADLGEQQHDIGVVMGEPAMLRLLRGAGVSDADIRGHDDVRTTRIYGCFVEVERGRRAVEDLPEADDGGVVFKDLTLASVLEELFSQSRETSSSVGPDAGRVVRRF
jgi:hypothetical protein